MRRLLASVVLMVLLGVALVVSNGLQPQTDWPAPAGSETARPGTTQSSTALASPARPGTPPSLSSPPPASSLAPSAADGGTVANPSRLPTIRESELPREGRLTLALIRQGGPFPYERDGVTFGNFERILPRKPGGYYKEYTVPTPGESDRGARRIVAGKAGDKYYTADHYESFTFIAEGK
ncbi:ribonuclease domain-containing protein [Arthrobacter sp. D1-17]